MAGKHGTLREYYRAYSRYGGTPPIPNWADSKRGDTRDGHVWKLLYVPVLAISTALLVPVMLALQQPVGTPTLGALGALWVMSQGFLSMWLAQPVADWWADLPRRGLPQIDFQYDAGTAPGVEVSD